MIDEQTIREKAAELEQMMQRLERFRETGYIRETCTPQESEECPWQRGEVLDEDGDSSYVLYTCTRCGLEQTRHLVWHSSSTEDPWADMRPDGGEEE
tara:strand:- start:371 stop:661 length:291 start_codon:yes stop_codon:yes gene_type:complete